ncbi:hypothetical protein SHKM778_36770 [Streptomyces sp. KM77-8]|uniref:Uncharacterized protein n=1 Tax=Streptomyces haneummycinicus TaxID=3074435 RepID=A0AAT9HIQ4_9ACTN
MNARSRARLGALGGVVILAVLVWRVDTRALGRGCAGSTGDAAGGGRDRGRDHRLQRVAVGGRGPGVGIRLPFGAAVADYYRALFLNAALPGGVLGDVHRAVRHGQSAGDMGRGCGRWCGSGPPGSSRCS